MIIYAKKIISFCKVCVYHNNLNQLRMEAADAVHNILADNEIL